MSKARILMVDDHQLFRNALAAMINQQDDMQVVGEANDGFEALQLARDLRPDLVLMDINMPVCDGLEATRRLRLSDPEVTIIILTIQHNHEKLIECIRAGANGYLVKEASLEGFIRGLRGVLQGEAALPRDLATQLIADYQRLSRKTTGPLVQPSSELLTSREVEILKLIARKASNKQIASRLSVSLYTVKSHVRNILEKLGAKNRHQAVAAARNRNILPPDFS